MKSYLKDGAVPLNRPLKYIYVELTPNDHHQHHLLDNDNDDGDNNFNAQQDSNPQALS